jgi:hypothetical protein
MEGDGPTGCMVIPEWVELRHKLQEKVEKATATDAVYPMLAKMLEKTQEYLDEALGCETLVMATILHPLFRLKFFHKWFGGKFGAIPMKAESTLRRLYSDYATASPRRQSGSSNEELHAKTSAQHTKSFHVDSDEDNEDDAADSIDTSLEDYLRMADKMRQKDYNLGDPKASLMWWSVSYFILISR